MLLLFRTHLLRCKALPLQKYLKVLGVDHDQSVTWPSETWEFWILYD